ncbi:hypothetical protein LEP1GSC088_1199 [Leptospira interrogans str. L1207]|nr:hypothetical protein LEP1GSC088_1199 [Leptospira interrogans str. L1207]
MHYFPGELIRAMKLPLYQRIFHELTFSDQNEGEAFVRYILLNTHSTERDEIIRNLKKGNYVSVIKIADYMEDPKITELNLTDVEILFSQAHLSFQKCHLQISDLQRLLNPKKPSQEYKSFLINRIIFSLFFPLLCF